MNLTKIAFYFNAVAGVLQLVNGWVINGSVFSMALVFAHIHFMVYLWKLERERQEREFHEWWAKTHTEPSFDIV